MARHLLFPFVSMIVFLVGATIPPRQAAAQESEKTPEKTTGTNRRSEWAASFAPFPMAEVAWGVTRRDTPLVSYLDAADLDPHSNKRRILLVGGLDGRAESATGVVELVRWFHQVAPPAVRDRLALSAIPQVNPDGIRAHLGSSNGSGGDPSRGYPPQGPAYSDRANPESSYLWRWIGMQAPDLVMVVEHGDARRWEIPPEAVALNAMRLALRKLEPQDVEVVDSSAPRDTLAVQLAQNAPSGTGSIPALTLRLPATQAGEAFGRLVQALADAPLPISPARIELQRRHDRTPLEVSRQLARHYGHSLEKVEYIAAVALMGRVRLGDLDSNEQHLRDVEAIVAPYATGGRSTVPASGSGQSGHLVFVTLADHARSEPARRRYVELVRVAADSMFEADGRRKEAMPFHLEMSDAVFMGGPILASAGRLTGEARYFEACVAHLRFMWRLVRRGDGIYRHSPLDETAWGRGNGFPALGLALCLTEFPDDHPDRPELLDAFRAHLEALLPHQDRFGCWHQVVDHPESYRELSCTCMITFAMIRGLRRGWLGDEYRAPIEKAWNAIRLRVASDGGLVDVCTGTGKQKSLREYYDRDAILGRDPRGGAMSLLVATELAAWEQERSNQR